jgi:glucose dehydrogenase
MADNADSSRAPAAQTHEAGETAVEAAAPPAPTAANAPAASAHPNTTEQPPIEPDSASQTDDSDSAYGDNSDTASYTTSLMSEVKNYKYENNRRYHSYREGAYVLPNDEAEQDRQDLLHHVRNLTLGGQLFLAPLKDPIRALDIGTGTGIWAIDFGDEFPNCEVIGTDLRHATPPHQCRSEQ